MPATTHPRQSARRSVKPATWWAKAWQRAVEEAAYDQGDLIAGRRLARAGRVGGIILDAGSYVAAVEDPGGLFSVAGTVPVLDDRSLDALVEAVAATPGRIAALLAGDLPHDLVEHAEELGAELLPYGGELGSVCTCDHWADPCPHALAVCTQVGWLLDTDPLVLFALRGLPRDDLLGRLHTLSLTATAADGPDADDATELDDLDVALEAALRAHRLLREWE
ncbi:hypothetical protein [Nocardioides insulae]|uniref:SWIM zinc finger family protein n=1 Tax=Nocardioides insulae TaxID=394734 RepID=UPI000426E546|nr:hypothetical protein [Nocardioides insulae]